MLDTMLLVCVSAVSSQARHLKLYLQDKNKWITTRQHCCAFVNTLLPNNKVTHIKQLELREEICFLLGHSGEISATEVEIIQESKVHELHTAKMLTLKQETEALLLEVTELIKQMKADHEGENSLELEKQRNKLGMEIVCMSLWRLQQLLAAMRKNTLELWRHFDSKSCQLLQVQNQVYACMYEKIKYPETLSQKNEVKHSEFITEYCMKLKETEEKIIKDEKHLEELVKQKAEIHEDVKCWNSKVKYLDNKIAAQGDESVELSDAASMIKTVEESKEKNAFISEVKNEDKIMHSIISVKFGYHYLGENTLIYNKIKNETCKQRLKNSTSEYFDYLIDFSSLSNKKMGGMMFKQQNVQMVFNNLQDNMAEYEKGFVRASLDQMIIENLWLYQEYQIFQSYYLNSKTDLTEICENSIRPAPVAAVAVAVALALPAWPSRHPRAMEQGHAGRVVEPLQRGLSSQAGLARIQAASQENAQKILAVQGELSKAIQHITAFLRSLTDGSPTTDNNANNQCILDAGIKDKKSHTVQITV
ncbi:LOW QUALITY PROTEIN: coiled-coil domain-containing protein 178 [Passerculus sandwichensis]